MVDNGTIPPEKITDCQWTLLRGKKPKFIFHNIGNLWRPLESVPASRERVVPTEGKSAQSLETAYQEQERFQFKRLSIGKMR